MSTKMSTKMICIASLLLVSSHALGEPLRFATYPDVSADQVVFVYRDAIWIAPVADGAAQLLSDIGERPRNPKFSADGQKVAYAASVDDNQDIYVASLSGGDIRRGT